MVVGCLRLTLQLAESHSLKSKRTLVRPLLERLQRKFNVSAAEVEAQDAHQRATIGVVCVSNDAAHSHAVLMQVLRFVEESRLDAEVSEAETEILQAL